MRINFLIKTAILLIGMSLFVFSGVQWRTFELQKAAKIDEQNQFLSELVPYNPKASINFLNNKMTYLTSKFKKTSLRDPVFSKPLESVLLFRKVEVYHNRDVAIFENIQKMIEPRRRSVTDWIELWPGSQVAAQAKEAIPLNQRKIFSRYYGEEKFKAAQISLAPFIPEAISRFGVKLDMRNIVKEKFLPQLDAGHLYLMQPIDRLFKRKLGSLRVSYYALHESVFTFVGKVKGSALERIIHPKLHKPIPLGKGRSAVRSLTDFGMPVARVSKEVQSERLLYLAGIVLGAGLIFFGFLPSIAGCRKLPVVGYCLVSAIIVTSGQFYIVRNYCLPEHFYEGFLGAGIGLMFLMAILATFLGNIIFQPVNHN